MRRLQFFEFLDQPWCPRAVRDGATDCLEAIARGSDIYRTVRVDFFHAIHRCGATRVVDLCSGGGGPWLSRFWMRELDGNRAPALEVFLTDKFPSRELAQRLAGTRRISAVERPVDATAVPAELAGFRTIFSSFHHFPDHMAVRILADAVAAGEGFASAEVTARSRRVVSILFFIPLLAWWITPRMRPFRWSRLFLTYLLPAIPFVLWWDGLVSCARTRTPEELLELTRAFPGYEWRAGYAHGAGCHLPPVYLLGYPRP